MQDWKRVALNGAVFGLVVGAGYHLIKHGWGGNWAAGMTVELVYSGLIGAVAGALAFIVRRSAG